MLADGARTAPDGKLYIFGGQWDRIFTAAVPTTHPCLAVVLVIEVGWNEAMQEHAVELILQDADGRDVGPRATARFRTGHPAGLVEGESVIVPLAIEMRSVTFPAFGRYLWRVNADGQPIGALPLSVVSPPTLPGMSMAPPEASTDET